MTSVTFYAMRVVADVATLVVSFVFRAQFDLTRVEFLGEHAPNTRVSVEDAGRHCGRRGHLPSVSLEDANRLIEIYFFF